MYCRKAETITRQQVRQDTVISLEANITKLLFALASIYIGFCAGLLVRNPRSRCFTRVSVKAAHRLTKTTLQEFKVSTTWTHYPQKMYLS